MEGSSGLADAAIASRAADVSAVWSVIDFTDDLGFAGDVSGSNPWPLATALGQSGANAPANTDFAARISGFLNIAVADTYTFKTLNDDGVRLRIGGNTVISDNGYHPELPFTGSLFLNPGAYALELIFFEQFGEASLEFAVAQGQGAFGLVGAPGGPTTSPTAVPTPALLPGLMGIGMAMWRKRKGELA
jgi:PA14 domain